MTAAPIPKRHAGMNSNNLIRVSMPRRSVLGLAMESKDNKGKTTQVPTGRVIGVRRY